MPRDPACIVTAPDDPVHIEIDPVDSRYDEPVCTEMADDVEEEEKEEKEEEDAQDDFSDIDTPDKPPVTDT